MCCWDSAKFDELKPKCKIIYWSWLPLGCWSRTENEKNEEILILKKTTTCDITSIDDENKASMLVQLPPLEKSLPFSAASIISHDEEGETSMPGKPRESLSPPPSNGRVLGRNKRAATRIVASDDEEGESSMQMPARNSSPQLLLRSGAVQNKVVRRSKRITTMAHSNYNLETLSNDRETRQKR